MLDLADPPLWLPLSGEAVDHIRRADQRKLAELDRWEQLSRSADAEAPMAADRAAAPAPAVRDATATRHRILQAATVEFAASGLAGARVSRIAERARANQRMIYAYFGSKDGLFDAVLEHHVLLAQDAVTFEATDLPGYAQQVFDVYRTHPHLVRLALWQALERPDLMRSLAPVVPRCPGQGRRHRSRAGGGAGQRRAAGRPTTRPHPDAGTRQSGTGRARALLDRRAAPRPRCQRGPADRSGRRTTGRGLNGHRPK